MDNLSSLPSVEKVVTHTDLAAFSQTLPREVRVGIVRSVIQAHRELLEKTAHPASLEIIVGEVKQQYAAFAGLGLRRAVNATGTVLHTGLGRAPLGKIAVDALAREMWGYSNLEWDLSTGERGSRTAALEQWVCALTGAEAAAVVNNGAAAVLLAVSALARNREAVISRGELVQIGGGFKIPEIIEAAGVRLLEVGTTNITSLDDYAKAVRADTGLVMKVHQSCFVMSGHVESVSLSALAKLADQNRLPLFMDLGSGSFGQRAAEDLSVRDALRAGCSVVSFSGDKLLGGAQAGILVGKAEWIRRIKGCPIYRALRLGKTEIFLMEHAIRAMISGEQTLTQQLLSLTVETLRARALRLQESLAFLPALVAGSQQRVVVSVVDGESSVGGGAAPSESLPSQLVKVTTPAAKKWARALLAHSPPIVCRQDSDSLQFDMRTLFADDEAAITDAFRAIAQAEPACLF